MEPSDTNGADSVDPSQHDHSRHAQVIAPALARLPIHFFTIGVLSLGCVGFAAPVVMPTAVESFYQPGVLALVHTLTLGVITAVMMGVMYRYVPALVHRPISFPRLAYPQLFLFVVGAVGMIAHFAIGNWVGLWWSATAVLLSVVLFALCQLPILWSGLGQGVAETGMFLAICYLLCAAGLGLLMGLDQAYGFAWVDLLRMLSALVVFPEIGWVTLTICAASYRFIPAFLLPTIKLPSAAIWQLFALALSVAGLGLTLLFGAAGADFWTMAVALSLIAYLVVLRRLIRSRRMKIDWGLRHAQAGAAWLVVAIVLGPAVAWTGAWSEEGVLLAGALGAAGLLGRIVNFIIGMSYQLFPGFVSRVRSTLSWPTVTIAELSVPRIHPLVFALYNGGAGLVVIAFLAASPHLAFWGSLLLGAGTSLYAFTTIWVLSFAYRMSVPACASRTLRVLG